MAKGQMVINYVPGEECRVAVVVDGKLSELHAERMDNVSHVGNIYVGKVVNVEAAIQAAFVDFGLEHNGFLHVSDLHPQYFPGEGDETTERVGKKTPRRDRPPIQECLRRGQEIAVQVLKEGVGTKGPTVTSYLSIPGRFLVMMPQMDRVGVSRKVEDEETRRKMREILDQLDLPEGFGFILRTAGMDRGKLELKRDLAYLSRLWKDMEKRWKSGNKPRLLYSESDLLVRSLRDILSTDIEEVVVDNESAVNRAARFLKIVAPRSSVKLAHYVGKAPIFHVMGLEEQIQNIHAREVPLPSGGRLVIDETEALVAIDVNSGKSRDARDAETNAFRTNMEAADEICRQLRLRDLGGVIVNDLIDMRFSKHRREVETKFKELLKKDRARWTTAPISEFGILEMTRQRMRGSHESQHFGDCPTCRGRGLVQRPDSVAADGMRELTAILDSDRVHRVEMVVSPRIAGELLSAKRRALSRIERASGKHVDVRVSEAIPVDRVTFYAYDDRGADLDVTKLGKRKVREDELKVFELARSAADDDWAGQVDEVEAEPVDEPQMEPEAEIHPIEIDQADDSSEPMSARLGQGSARNGSGGEDEGEGRRGRGRRRRRGRGRGRGGDAAESRGQRAGVPGSTREDAPMSDDGDGEVPSTQDDLGSDAPYTPRQGDGELGADGDSRPQQGGAAEPGAEGEPGSGGRRRRRRRRRGRGGRGDGSGMPGAGPAREESDGQPASAEGGFANDGGEFGSGAGDAEADAAAIEDNGAGVNGTAPADGSGGEGGGRRRRRRRRRGRGGRGPDGAPGMSEGAAEFAQSGGSDVQADDHAGPDVGGGDGGDESASQEGDEPRQDSPEGGGAGGPDGPRGGRRRRRRGRGRGRGGDGRGPGDGAPGNENSSGGGRRSGGDWMNNGNNNRPQQPPRSGGGGGEQRPQQNIGSGAGGNPPASPGGSKPPRVLYSSRRKLAPGERRGPAGDE